MVKVNTKCDMRNTIYDVRFTRYVIRNTRYGGRRNSGIESDINKF